MLRGSRLIRVNRNRGKLALDQIVPLFTWVAASRAATASKAVSQRVHEGR
jgi:hypothetical protein